jgi:hypothetical protein
MVQRASHQLGTVVAPVEMVHKAWVEDGFASLCPIQQQSQLRHSLDEDQSKQNKVEHCNEVQAHFPE